MVKRTSLLKRCKAGFMHRFMKSDKAIFSKNKFVGWRRRTLFLKMIMIIEAFPIIPIRTIRNITRKIISANDKPFY